MPKPRQSEAERVLGFFQTQPVSTAQVVLDLAKAVVKSRTAATSTRPVVRKATSAPKANGAHTPIPSEPAYVE